MLALVDFDLLADKDSTYFLMSCPRPGQMYLSLAILIVCCCPACLSSCSAFIAACRYAGGSRRMAQAVMFGGFAFFDNRRGPPFFSAQEKSRVEASHSAAARVRWSSFWAAKRSFSSQFQDDRMAQTSSASSSVSGNLRMASIGCGRAPSPCAAVRPKDFLCCS